METQIGVILIATVLSYIVGMVWYSPALFWETWRKGAKIKQKPEKPHFLTMVVWLISTFVMIYALSVLINFSAAASITQAVLVAVYAWAGFVATSLIGSVLWEKRPISFYLVNAMYFLVALILSAIILVVL